MPRGFGLEKLHTFLAQGQRHLDPLIAKRQFGRRRKEILDDTNLAQRLIAISYFHTHKQSFPFANNRHR